MIVPLELCNNFNDHSNNNDDNENDDINSDSLNPRDDLDDLLDKTDLDKKRISRRVLISK